MIFFIVERSHCCSFSTLNKRIIQMRYAFYLRLFRRYDELMMLIDKIVLTILKSSDKSKKIS